MKPAMLTLPLAMTACAPTPAKDPVVGMANPASVHCVKAGGRVEIRKETAGEVGYCHLPDGRVIEEWTFFRASQDKDD